MKHKILNDLGRYFFYLLLVISVVMAVVYYLKTGSINQDDPTGKQMSEMGPTLNYFFYWIYALAAIAILFAVGMPLINMVSSPKKGLKTLISVVLLVALVLVAYQFADGTLLEIPGYDGPDNIPSRLKMTDTVIFSVYAMAVVAIGAVLYTEISKLFK